MRNAVADLDTKAPSHAERPRPVYAQPEHAAPAQRRRASATALLQAKLSVGPADDPFEREADTVAAAVMADIGRRPAELDDDAATPDVARAVRRSASISRVQAKAVPSIGLEGGALDSDTDALIEQARSGGSALDDGVRRTMESAFGADFSGVRVHDDSGAHDLSQKIQAKAFTTGSDIFFGKGQYQPGDRGGQELLAHELTHVVQQGGAGGGGTAARSVQRKSIPGLASLATGGGTWTDTGNGVFGFDVPTNADDVAQLVNAIRQATIDNPTRIKVLTGVHGNPAGHLVGTDVIDPAQFLAEDQEEEGHKGLSGWTNVLNVRDKKKDLIGGWMNAPSSVVILAWCYSIQTVANWGTLAADWEDGTKGTGFASPNAQQRTT